MESIPEQRVIPITDPNASGTPLGAEQQMVSTMLFVTLSGFAMSMVYYLFNLAYDQVRRRLVCSITINSSDDIYKMVISYLTQKGFLQGSMTQMKCQLKKKKWTWWWQRSKEEN